MSYRDLRNFTEMMRTLGYPRLMSMENFRSPNFPLVAEILIWLVKRFDPNGDISPDISSEDERVQLIRSTSHLLALKASLKLNTKKLYQADGYAVKELLKVTSLLYDSLKMTDEKNSEEEELPEISVVGTAMKIQELKQAAQLVADITTSGAALYELLGKEAELRELRNSRASRHLEMSQVEEAVKDSINVVSKEIDHTKQLIESVASNEATLDSKIEKKKTDLDRHMKRLQTLKKIRPAFMEEFEKLEEELKELYNDYVIKCRNIAYLESVLEQAEQAEQRRMDQKQAITRKILEDLKQEELSIRSTDIFADAMEEAKLKTSGKIEHRIKSRTAANHKDGHEPAKQRRVFGSMTGGIEDSESLDDSDSDLLLDGDITEDDDIEMDNRPIRDFSDDDF